MPVPADMVRSPAGANKSGGPSLVEAAFAVEAENLKLPKLEAHDFGIGDEVEGDFFRVWLYAEDDEGVDEDSTGGRVVSKMLLMRFDENVRFDLQFGRRVMAKLLFLEDRLKWQDCTQTQEEETKDTEEFRKAFKDWDFTAN
ncbi:cwfJ domain-containing protein [Magnaporthiopsis poae ATCC 64411]|uniref:CwfJ domain-containing protein n=1 Tax=Magnaporthiopsis poae (strain ATCC 64411 / 73-15) TaxID=644358 RepID=A0A0C4DTV9_MAGP6|nr:cwfJ domain-containing protein [Magnaporthiopsis poae ATCC 64411]